MLSKLTNIPSVPDFYKGSDILITGSTGFLGLVLIEKLLRSCYDLNKIYAIVRPKRGKSVQERKSVFYDSVLFDDLLKNNPKALDKLELIEGDISLPRLGVSEVDRKRLENVSVVFHSAASIRFDEPLKEAILSHVRGTRELLELSLTFKKVRAFVHVSTAYCNMDLGSLEDVKANRLKEIVYPNMDDWQNVIKLAENLDADTLNILTTHFTKYSVNTYLYTKALAENVCSAYQDKIPVVIYRPTVVIGKGQEPLRGWSTTLNGPAGLSIAGFMGIMQCMYGRLENPIDMVFVDASINGMIVAACKRHLIDTETAVYISTSARASSQEIIYNIDDIKDYAPMSMTIWRCTVGDTTCIYNFKLQSVLFHMIPAILIDTALKLTGNQPRLLKLQQKIQKTQLALVHFVTHAFEMHNFKYLQLKNFLNESDKKTFDMIMKDVTAESVDFIKKTQKCARKFIIKDPDETIPAARKRIEILIMADKVVKFLFYGGIAYKFYDYMLFSMIGIPTIPSFYANRDVFITGATGFVGKVLIEKLLRSCSEINRIFILVRNKKGKAASDRIKEFEDCPLFDKVRAEDPNILSKLVPVFGDVTQLGLGLSDSDKKLMENVSVIFHSAASVRFDDPLKEAILMNTRGTREMLDFALTLKDLKVFLHVSTTYCNADHKVIEERVYEPHMDWRKAIQIAETTDAYTLDILCKKFTDNLPNTYVFTKGLSENACDEYKHKIPISIFRPAVVIGIQKEPIPGWCANFNGPTGLIVGAGSGVIRGFCCDMNSPLYCTPADTCVNAIIVAAWKKAVKLDKETLPIYNCATGKTNVAEMTGPVLLEASRKYPLSLAIWVPNGTITSSPFIYFFVNIFVHVLPAILLDTVLKLAGKPPMLLRLQRKVTNAGDALRYFVTKRFDMRCQNYISLPEFILPDDKPAFDFIVHEENVDRYKYMMDQVIAGRVYLLKDPMENLPAARKKMKILVAIDFAVKFILFPLIFYFLFGKQLQNVFQRYFLP
ncbi:uncharacterized protein LOC134837352 [Culicoides brevitarsis]|uniref:uncharacterized protein LOC134837352 n=1 Tax=Culicoides brevitarsis TaxID=469753 RepID=UPI00307C354E